VIKTFGSVSQTSFNPLVHKKKKKWPVNPPLFWDFPVLKYNKVIQFIISAGKCDQFLTNAWKAFMDHRQDLVNWRFMDCHTKWL